MVVPAVNHLILQLADSAFPTGGFVHSGGLEAAARMGLISEVTSWIRDGLEHAAHAALPLASAGFDRTDILALDDEAEAWLTSTVANRASRAQGQAWLGTAVAVFQTDELRALKQELRAAGSPCHLAPLYGRICALLGLARDEMQRLFLFLHLRAQVSTAVRLGLMGPLEGQRFQAACTADLAALQRACAGLTLDDLVATAPLLDVAQAHHDQLYSRMFAT